jgi:cytidylate kinase
MIIVIDGPVATGKSSVAKKLADELGYIYFDTGAMYRAFTWFVLHKNGDINDPKQLDSLIKEFDFLIKVKQGEKKYFVNGEDVSLVIRGKAVTEFVSEVSAHPEVREKLVGMQREFAQGVNAIFEGRDMGTVVFPNADIKIFLTARPDIRAQRRYHELKTKFPNDTKDLTLEFAQERVNIRDKYDSTRVTSPLKQAADADLIDTSELTIDEIVLKIMELKDAKKSKSQKKS